MSHADDDHTLDTDLSEDQEEEQVLPVVEEEEHHVQTPEEVLADDIQKVSVELEEAPSPKNRAGMIPQELLEPMTIEEWMYNKDDKIDQNLI